MKILLAIAIIGLIFSLIYKRAYKKIMKEALDYNKKIMEEALDYSRKNPLRIGCRPAHVKDKSIKYERWL